METIKSSKIGKAWKKLAKKVLDSNIINDGNIKLKEITNISLQLEGKVNLREKNTKYDVPIFDGYEFEFDEDLKKFYNKEMLDWMRKNFFDLNDVKGWGYSYGQRIFSYGPNKINQLQKVIDKLKKNPESKSAAFTLMMPGYDNEHYPCVTEFSFFIRENKLLFNVTMRSQDIGKKAYADYLCYWDIANLVCGQLNLNIFEINILINSAHIYETGWKKMEEFTK